MSKFSSKGEQYAAELASARLRGEWATSEIGNSSTSASGGSSSAAVAAASGKKTAEWSELLRKFIKHNPDSKLVADVAAAEQELRVQLATFYASQGYGDHSHAQDSAAPTHKDTTTFPPVASDSVYASSIVRAVEKLAMLQQQQAKTEVQRNAIAPIHALGLHALGRDEDAVALLHDARFIESLQIDDLKDVRNSEDYTVALLMMGFVVYGMANERLHHADPSAGYAPFAFAGYARAIDLHEGVRGGKAANALRGLSADEIERWAENALYRNALLSVREGDMTLGLNALRAYQAHAGRWPSDFRIVQRSVIYRTYLQALNRSVEESNYLEPPSLPPKSTNDPRSQAYQFNVVQAVASRVSVRNFARERTRRDSQRPVTPGVTSHAITSRTVSTRRPNKHLALRPGSTVWSNEMLTVSLLASSAIKRGSAFPKAGRLNAAALDLADALVRGWELDGEKGGADADELAQTLYTLAKLSFGSQRIARSLVRVLAAAELYDEAKLALELYVKLVDKSRQADAAQSDALASETSEGKRVNGGGAPATANGMVNGTEKHAKDLAHDADDAKTYVCMLAFGSRLCCKYLCAFADADKFARKALEIAQKDKQLSDKAAVPSLLAQLKRVAGTARSALAIAEGSPLTRSQTQQEALALLLEAADLDAQSAETFYHLAFVQAELRDVAAATVSARRAVELEPASIEPWHLLTLLLSCNKDYKGALTLAEVALEQAEKDDGHDQSFTTKEGLQSRAVVNGVSVAGPTEVRTALLSYDYPPRGSERAESILRLLTTHNALEEVVEGTEAAIEGQKEIFTFFHDRIATDATLRNARAGNTTLPKTNTVSSAKMDNDYGISTQKRSSRLSTLLHIHSPSVHVSGVAAVRAASAAPDARTATLEGGTRYGTVTGLGQSGAWNVRSTTLSLNAVTFGTRSSRALTIALPPPAATDVSAGDGEDWSPESQRFALHARRETDMLSSLWLMSAATFRRAGKLSECRIAVQEAERIAPNNPSVWLQLALWFVESDNIGLATSSLYKALACKGDHIASSVHLARIFLSNPDSIPATSHDSSAFTPSAQMPTPVPRPGVKHDFLDSPQSRSIGVSPKVKDYSPGGKETHFKSTAETTASRETKKLTALSLAEGLLNTTTASSGWDVPEAWLFIGHVAQKTGRPERAAECLRYALALEETKPIQPLSIALERTT
ncbi:TPR-like protein [Tilletiaria anomala UBC 951]|uniref:TPR-like protein n=1 Tax=Tilletiaria anomala (strain ATCC 24038 / CBS 436.72 / UBC 951) TaxID=1037660 RepID=A0A066W7E5_TILAU|nr:TPR-like protein [Tilletiaria anomala UBC 951]KDN48453.1 TPR-like protein [Tilletiaria anomala UBC 951]